MVGPILAEDAKPLPADINAFLDEALTSGHPAVYVSMGTLAMPSEEELLSMVRGLSALPNPVLWKLDSQMLPGKSGPNAAMSMSLLATLALCHCLGVVTCRVLRVL